MKILTPLQKRELKARAHALDPVVMISDKGLSPAVAAETDRALKSHELIKLRVFGADRRQRESLLADICARTGAQAVQHIGKILVIYRENPVQRKSSAERPPPRSGRANPAKGRPTPDRTRAKRPGRAPPRGQRTLNPAVRNSGKRTSRAR